MAPPHQPISLPAYEAELLGHQRSALRAACLIAAPILLAFSLLDRAQAPQAFGRMLVVRIVAAALLVQIARWSARFRFEALAFGTVAVVTAAIEFGVFATGGVRSPYLVSNIAVLAGVGMLLPLTVRQAIFLQATCIVIVFLPLLVIEQPGDELSLATTASYLLTVAILAVAGAHLSDGLRRREHRARVEVARQMGLINLGTLAGGLAHELANPLTTVSLELDILDEKQLPLEAREKLRSVRLGVARMRDILLAMKQGARFSSGEVREVQLHAEVDLALTLVSQRIKGGVTVERQYAPDAPLVSCQPTLLGQLLVNLLINSLDAMAGQRDARLTVRVRKGAEGAALVEVEDSGPGIPEELRERIFEPFFSTKGDKGNGLGLWISLEIARVHGGELVALGAPGGALFRLSLPVQQARAAASAA